MTYSFPPSLEPLRKYLKGRGFAGDSIKTSRQAAFVAQQLLGTRIKFPPQGSDMTPTLLSIQEAVRGVVSRNETPVTAFPQKSGKAPAKAKKPSKPAKTQPTFTPDMFAEGIHIFCDGAAVPNPGVGGWGVVVYRDGVEIETAHGGEAVATNNRMEMMGLLVAIEKAKSISPDLGPPTIWCDSQYCVEGVNAWLILWKAREWNKRKLTSPKRAEGEIKNLELWKAIDAALGDRLKTELLAIRWVKGHVGVAGNERADELAEIGRQEADPGVEAPIDDLDAQYRQIMGAM